MQVVHQNIDERARFNLVEKTELLRSRQALLEGKDREIMRMYLENGTTYKQLANLTGMHECSIARWISRIQRRLLDEKYITCLRNRERFTNLQMAMAKEHFVNGCSINKISEKFHTSFHTAKKAIGRIEESIEKINEKKSIRV